MVADDAPTTFKLGEILVLASSAKLIQLLLGFPSYGALGLTLGVAGAGTFPLTKVLSFHTPTTSRETLLR